MINDFETDEKNKAMYESADEDIASISSSDEDIEDHPHDDKVNIEDKDKDNLENLVNNLKLELDKLKHLEEEESNNTPKIKYTL